MQWETAKTYCFVLQPGKSPNWKAAYKTEISMLKKSFQTKIIQMDYTYSEEIEELDKRNSLKLLQAVLNSSRDQRDLHGKGNKETE